MNKDKRTGRRYHGKIKSNSVTVKELQEPEPSWGNPSPATLDRGGPGTTKVGLFSKIRRQ